jgi:hypothetical protein
MSQQEEKKPVDPQSNTTKKSKAHYMFAAIITEADSLHALVDGVSAKSETMM